MNNQTFQQLLAEGKVIGVLKVETRNRQVWQQARVNHGEGIITDEWFQIDHIKPLGRPPLNGHRVDINWATVDWNKSSRELARGLGVSYSTVNAKRFLVGHPKLGTTKTRHIDWAIVDWTKNNQQLSGELGIGIGSIAGYRQRVGKPSEGYMPRKVSEEMVQAVDWLNTKDVTIARQWSVSRERVRQLRLVKKLPRCIITTNIRTLQEIERWLLENKASIAGKLAHDVAELCPVKAERTVKFRAMKKVDIQFIWRRAKSSLAETYDINWELPNNLLTWVWNHCNNWAATNRWELQKPKPKWFRNGNLVSREQFCKIPGLLKAVLEEMDKARKIGVEPNIVALRDYGFDVS